MLFRVSLELQLGVPATAYHWLHNFRTLRWRGKPDSLISPTYWQEWLQADRQGAAVCDLSPAPAAVRAP